MIKLLLSIPYQLAHFIRENLFIFKCDLGLEVVKELDRPVISVGNISFGGTGKTPFCFELIKYLTQNGLKVGFLTRGYKSQSEYGCTIFPTHDFDCTVEEIGDEAYMLAKKFQEENINVYFGVGQDRYNIGLNMQDLSPSLDVFVLDDGLQHFKLKRDVEIILENINESGYYREFEFALNKADFLIYSKVDKHWISNNLGKNSMSLNPHLTKKLHSENDVGVFTGIADYITLTKMLETHLNQEFQRNDTQIRVFNYPDHHFFNIQEIKEAIDSGIQLVTTEKDWSKIPEEYRSFFTLVKIDLEFQPKDLLAKILSSINKRG